MVGDVLAFAFTFTLGAICGGVIIGFMGGQFTDYYKALQTTASINTLKEENDVLQEDNRLLRENIRKLTEQNELLRLAQKQAETKEAAFYLKVHNLEQSIMVLERKFSERL